MTAPTTAVATPAALADPRLSTPTDRLGPREVVILGSTGSIGTQAIDVIRRSPGRFRVLGLAAGAGRLDLLADQARELDVPTVAVARTEAAPVLRQLLADRYGVRPLPRILSGPDAATALAGTRCDVVLNGITGSIGLAPTLAALESGAILALANKESLVAGGPLVRQVARPGQIVPVDSEHAAIYQCLSGGRDAEVRRLILTASGGPFRGRSRADLATVTPEQALAHPTWDMGPMVTVNSASLMNKGLEVIEAHLLFGMPFDRIDVVVHPQSVVHSMVEFTDGSTLAQVSPPDMRLPISLGLGWPERVPDAAPACDWTQSAAWTFFPLDEEAFPAVALARFAGEAGGVAPAVFNAANEECVAAFLDGRLPFPEIVATVRRVVQEQVAAVGGAELTLDDVLNAEKRARVRARQLTHSG
ncbi:1-deoxy-D-xylulose-5-phosphate reductoisomerase [Streptomyces boninensis]|uniref:1-deoxy-D-xylulose-5-phosphate reductoisomerase n=1 Tax=Streptomyces boninensis TaxID=2039455 RepID=UPI003B20C3B1